MDLFSDLQTAVQTDLTIDSNSPLFTPTIIKLAINRAYRKAGGLFDWPETEDAKLTTTQANIEYYDYPVNWRPDSMWKLTVNGDDNDYGDPIAYKDFLYEKEQDWPSGADVAWSSQWRRYFIYPIPTVAGQVISIHGFKVVDALVEDEDVTIFSYAMPECNEAIVLEAVAILKNKGEEEQKGQFRSAEAKGILAVSWSRIKKSLAKYEKTTPLFNVPDFFGANNTSTKIGKF
jgi:hypothetical protein